MSEITPTEKNYAQIIESVTTLVMGSKLAEERKEEILQKLRAEEPTLMFLCETTHECETAFSVLLLKIAQPVEPMEMKYVSGLKKHLVDDETIFEEDTDDEYLRWSELVYEDKIETAPGVKLISLQEDGWDDKTNKVILAEDSLDFENFSIIEITDEYAKFCAGGDWQQGSILTVKLADNGLLYFTECIPLTGDDEKDPKFSYPSNTSIREALGLPVKEKS